LDNIQSDRELISSDFIEMLPMLRARLGITQNDLANKIGATRQTIISIETKKRPLAWSMFLAMMFIFFFDSRTRPFLKTAGITNETLSNLLFNNLSTLTEAESILDKDEPMLSQAKRMMENIDKIKN